MLFGSADGIPVNCLGKCPKVDTAEKDTRLFPHMKGEKKITTSDTSRLASSLFG